MLTVVAALIESDGKVLVCQRRRGDALGLMWEFPGGKRRPNETLENALARELREELGVESDIGAEVYRTRHEYAHMREPLELIFFRASLDAARIQNWAFEAMEWHALEDLPALDFLPADRELVTRLAAGELLVTGEGRVNAPHQPTSGS